MDRLIRLERGKGERYRALQKIVPRLCSKAHDRFADKDRSPINKATTTGRSLQMQVVDCVGGPVWDLVDVGAAIKELNYG